ncbi:MAG: gluconate 2-dehydrogenase subunit 3 family protein [Gemmatimonadaceae bacterium]
MRPMHRRDALKAAAILAGGATLLGALGAAAGGAAAEVEEEQAGVLRGADRALAVAIADTLLPTTEASPGARAAGAGAAMDLLLTDCYPADEQRRLLAGLADFRAAHPGFAALARREREAVLRELDRAALTAAAPHWFALARGLAEQAYFSSEVGMTRALRYVRVPGRWVGCVPLKPGQPAWG